MGGMAAQIPVKDNPTLTAKALESVRVDKVRTEGEAFCFTFSVFLMLWGYVQPTVCNGNNCQNIVGASNASTTL